MSCCGGASGSLERYPGTGCCGTSCSAGKTGCPASESRIRSCLCQENVGCLDRAECGGFRPRGTAATGACPGPCQCAEEEAWNRNVPPKPNCEWLTNFSELRRQWSDHGRQNNCKCCNCKPCRTAAPCKPCLPPIPRCSTIAFSPDNCQECCNERLSGGACGSSIPKFCSPAPRQLDCGPSSAMTSSHGCSPPSCNSPSACCSSGGKYCASPCDSPSQCSLTKFSTSPCRPPSSCQPCSPSPRPILKKRSCCQCITGGCMCQPMPRNCNCPPPVQVDARAEKECSCECPSSPECACPPSERKFPNSKVKCPNARLCCPMPRPQPGPKCRCTKCQPCLPPPCDPCTSSKCRTVTPKMKPCCGESPCDDAAPCRPDTPRLPSPCRPTPPCSDCRKMAPPCRTPQLENPRQALRQIRPLNRPRSPDFRCPLIPGCHKSDEGCGDDNGDEAETVNHEAQCHCGASDTRGCDVLCDYCCSLNCDDDIPAEETRKDDYNAQCNCGDDSAMGHHGCHEKCDYCCSLGCADDHPSNYDEQCCCDADGNGCAKNCDYCCSLNCDSVMEPIDKPSSEKETTAEPKSSKNKKKGKRIAAGGTMNDTYDDNHDDNDDDQLPISRCDLIDDFTRNGGLKKRVKLQSIGENADEASPRAMTINGHIDNEKSLKSMFRRADVCIINDNDDDPQDVAKCCKSQSPKVKISSAVAESRRSPCRLLRSLIRAKSPRKNFEMNEKK